MEIFTIFLLAFGDWKTRNSLDFDFDFFEFHFLAKFCQKRGCLGHIWKEKAMASCFHGVQFGRKTFFCTWLKLETKRGLIAKTMYLT